MGNMNMDDPAKQEAIRRGPHQYVANVGKHGVYVHQPYDRAKNEYPKMMATFPKPQPADFKGKPESERLYEEALREWDRAMTGSIVNSKSEELQWMKQNAS